MSNPFRHIKDVFAIIQNGNPSKVSEVGPFKIINTSPEEALSLPALAPDEMDGLKMTYHYQDVRLEVPWQIGGGYGQSTKSIGVKRGDRLEIVPNPTTVNGEQDPHNISIMWKRTILGDMRANKLRTMVHSWLQAGLPIYCGVTMPSTDRRFYIEFGFYGKPQK